MSFDVTTLALAKSYADQHGSGGGGTSTADKVGYTNAELPNISTVEEALDELVTKSHAHTNKAILDLLSDSSGKLQYNGSDVGLKGDKGDTGARGEAFLYSDFTAEQLAALKGDKGEKGLKGDKGTDGKTPVKGVDYWTADDQESIVNDVLAALPDGDEVSY